MTEKKETRLAANGRPAKTAGRVLIGGHFHPSVALQLRMLAAETGTTIQQLLTEGLNHVFRKHGLAKIADIEETATNAR